MSIHKRGGVYWYEFEFKGKTMRHNTGQGNRKTALQMQEAHRLRLEKGVNRREVFRDAMAFLSGSSAVVKLYEFFKDQPRRPAAVDLPVRGFTRRAFGAAQVVTGIRTHTIDSYLAESPLGSEATAKAVVRPKQTLSMLPVAACREVWLRRHHPRAQEGWIMANRLMEA